MFRLAAPTAALVSLLALSACAAPADEPVEEVRPVRTARIGAQAGTAGATYSGDVRARREAALGFMIGGRIQRRLVEVGDTVEAGTPLFQLDPTDAALNANASRTQVESARSQYQQYKRDYERYAELAKSHFVAHTEAEKMRLQMETAQQSLRAAQANYGVAANQASYTTLRATSAGVITAISAEAGNVVDAGRIVVKIAERGEREIVISIPEARVEELRSARALAVELWAAPGRRYTGRLRELAPDTDSVTRTYSARVSIVDADDKVGLGMTGKLLVDLPSNPQLRRVPLTALYDTDGHPKVWVVDPKTSRFAARAVVVTQAQKDGVLISAGLHDGDVVVTAGVHLLHAGQKVHAVGADASGVDV